MICRKSCTTLKRRARRWLNPVGSVDGGTAGGAWRSLAMLQIELAAEQPSRNATVKKIEILESELRKFKQAILHLEYEQTKGEGREV